MRQWSRGWIKENTEETPTVTWPFGHFNSVSKILGAMTFAGLDPMEILKRLREEMIQIRLLHILGL